MKLYLKSMTFLSGVLGCSLMVETSSALAACVSGDCAGLGYTKSASDCSGVDAIRCPFDTSKYFCVKQTATEEDCGWFGTSINGICQCKTDYDFYTGVEYTGNSVLASGQSLVNALSGQSSSQYEIDIWPDTHYESGDYDNQGYCWTLKGNFHKGNDSRVDRINVCCAHGKKPGGGRYLSRDNGCSEYRVSYSLYCKYQVYQGGKVKERVIFWDDSGSNDDYEVWGAVIYTYSELEKINATVIDSWCKTLPAKSEKINNCYYIHDFLKFTDSGATDEIFEFKAKDLIK